MPCSAGRELKQMLVNATNELAAATADAASEKTVPAKQHERRLQNAINNHAWTSSTLLNHLTTCTACRQRESALRPAFK
jgi:hypothetical protein